MNKPKIPKDLGLKVGSPTEVLWTNVRDNLLAQIKQAEDELQVNKEMLVVAHSKIAEENRKAKV